MLARLSILAIAAIVNLPATVHAQAKLPDGLRVEKNLEYGPHERNKLDVYVPKSEKPLPLIIWVHGGAWEAGDKGNGGPAVSQLARGKYAIAAVNYRFSKTAPLPAQIADVRAAVRYLRTNAKKYNLDPDRFAAWGASAGGHLVALLGTGATTKELDGDYKPNATSPAVQAVVDWFGPTDLTTIVPPDGTNAVSRLLGGTVNEKRAIAKLGSPVEYVTRSSAPLLMFHGDKDALVPLKQSEDLLAAYKKSGADAELIVLKGSGHGGPQFLNEENRKITEAFLDKHLLAMGGSEKSR